ncbi:MAG TPA: hypothetical protein PKW55_00500 [Spirochaetota bacterium]|nr:hypothetical protein [Spirochaetota bacterium]
MFSILSLFPVINLKFVVFHVMLIFILLFPYYFWIHSIKNAIITVLIVYIFSIGLFILTSISNPAKTKEIKTTAEISLTPKMTRIEFNFDKNILVYDFTDQNLKKVNDTSENYNKDKWNIFKYYYDKVNLFYKDIDYTKLKNNKLTFFKYILWILYLLLFAFAFSYRPSIVVSYSIIFFTLPYIWYVGYTVFLGDFSLLNNILKGIILVFLLTIGLVRAKM